MLAQSAVFGLNRSNSHQSAALAALATPTSCSTKFNSSLIHSTNPNYASMKNFPHRTMIPFNCGMEMQQTSNLHLSPNIFHEISLRQNQNCNNSQLSNSYLQSKTRFQSQSSHIQTINRTSEDIQI